MEIGATDQLLKAADYKPLIVAYRNGAPVRLADLGDVVGLVQDIRATPASRTASRRSCCMVFRQPGANIIDTVDRVKALLPQFRALLPAAVDLDVAIDRTTTIRASVQMSSGRSSSRSAGRPGGVRLPAERSRDHHSGCRRSLVAARDVRRDVLPRLQPRQSSLMALTISTGFVVDDAIVVIENVNRHSADGLAPIEAALLGAKEIGFTVVSMSASLIAVFIPILLMGGLVGRLFREFSVTLSVAVAVSMVVSLTTTPMMCAHLLRPSRVAPRTALQGERAGIRRAVARLRPQPDLDAAALAAHARDCVRDRRGERRPLHRYSERVLPSAGHRHAVGNRAGAQDTSYPGYPR